MKSERCNNTKQCFSLKKRKVNCNIYRHRQEDPDTDTDADMRKLKQDLPGLKAMEMV